jgi:L-aminopeptidase/D-esterase-like protein
MITKIAGIKVGHYTDEKGVTGCTVILCPNGAVAGVDVRGSAPGSRETELLKPTKTVQKIHAVFLSGGSAFGLDATAGVMRYLEERGIGYKTPYGVVPIIPAAILYDLGVGEAKARPSIENAYEACQRATTQTFEEGSVGAGTGATIGNILGRASWMKGGLGSVCQKLPGGVLVGALAVVNAVGDIIDEHGRIIAGARRADGQYLDTASFLKEHAVDARKVVAKGGENTTLVVLVTNAKLDKSQANKLAEFGHDGITQAVRPAHTTFDGDTVFALATGEVEASPDAVGVVAVEVTAGAIRRAVRLAKSIANIPSLK